MINLRRLKKGFTLIEVMVAFAIFATAAIGIYSSISVSTLSASRIEAKTLAHWVAQNRWVEIQSDLQNVRLGRQTDTVTLAKQEWWVETLIETSPVPTLWKIEIQVRLHSDPPNRWTTNLTEFLLAPKVTPT